MVADGLPAGSTAPRGFVPVGVVLSSFPGFSEYEFTYSRVRVLSCSVTVVNDQPGVQELYGGFAIAPSHDIIQSQLQVSGSSSVVLKYQNAEIDGASGSKVTTGLFTGFKVPGSTAQYESNTEVTGDVVTIGDPTIFGAADYRTITAIVTNGTNTFVKPSGVPIPDGYRVAPSNTFSEVPLSSSSAAELPPVTLNQLSQVKRYRVKFPSTSTRAFKVRFVPYTFLTGDGPVSNLDLAAMPKYFSSRRWMPLQWFSTAAGKLPLVLFGPYIAPLFAPEDVTQPINLHLYYHIRLQFAGQV